MEAILQQQRVPALKPRWTLLVMFGLHFTLKLVRSFLGSPRFKGWMGGRKTARALRRLPTPGQFP